MGAYVSANEFFELGKTYKDGETIDTANPPAPQLQGHKYYFEREDDKFAGNVHGRGIVAMLVRNSAAVALLPKKVARFKAESGLLGTSCDGYCFVVADIPAGVIDPFLPAAGVPVADLFWLIIEGEADVLTDESSTTDIAVGDRVVVLAGTNATSADSGKVAKQIYTVPSDATNTALLANHIQNVVGRAITAQTEVNSAIKVHVQLNK